MFEKGSVVKNEHSFSIMASMPKVTEGHRVERRRQIIDAAMRCFAKSGFERTSMADIIAESGMSAGAIYSYFKNKQDLIVHVTRDVLRERTSDLDGLVERDPLPPPSAVVRMFLDGMHRDLGNASIIIQTWAEAAAENSSAEGVIAVVGELRGLYARYLQVWFERRGAGAEEAATRARAMAPLIVALCQGYILQSKLIPDFDAEGYFEAVEMLDI